MGTENELKYRISTSSDTKGASETARAFEQVGAAAKETARNGEATTKAFGEVGQQVGDIQNAGRALSDLARGNLQPLANLQGVIKGIGTALRTNPLFLLGSLAGAVIVPAISKISDGFQAAKKRAEESSKATNEALETARKAIAERRRNETAERFREIADAASDAKRKIDLLTQAEIERLDADEAEAVARINADEKLSPLQRAEKLAATRQEFRQGRDAAQIDAIKKKQQADADALKKTEGELPSAIQAETTARRRLEELRARSPKAIEEELRAAKDRLPLVREASRNLFASPERRERFAAEASQLEANIPGLEKELADAQLNYPSNFENASDALAQATKEREALEKRILGAQAKKAAAEEEAAIQIQILTKRTQSQKAVDEIDLGVKRREDAIETETRRKERAQRRAEIDVEAARARDGGDNEALDRLVAERATLDAEDRKAASRSKSSKAGGADITALTEAVGATEAAISEAAPVDLAEATGGIITLGRTFVAIQGLNRQEFKRLDEAIKAASAEFRAELDRQKAAVENLRNSQG